MKTQMRRIVLTMLLLGLGSHAAPARAFFYEDFETDSILDWFSAEAGDEKDILVTDPLQGDRAVSWTQFGNLMAAPESYAKVALDPNHDNFLISFDFLAQPGSVDPIDDYIRDQGWQDELTFNLDSYATGEWQRISLGFTTRRDYVNVYNQFDKIAQNFRYNTALKNVGEMFFDNLEIKASTPPPPPPAPPLPALGRQLFSAGGEVVVQILPSTTVYTSTLCLLSPGNRCIATNRQVGNVYNLGSFAPDRELLFGIIVSDTGHTFKMGPGWRNGDGLVHSRIDFTSPNAARVGFEDIWGGGDRDYDDNTFLFLGGISSNANPTLTNLTENVFNLPRNAPFNFGATATDPGLYDVLTYEWDFDGDGIYSDFAGSKGLWSFSRPGLHNVGLRVSDGRGGYAYGSFQVEVVPEPSTWLGLIAVGVSGGLLRKKRRVKK